MTARRVLFGLLLLTPLADLPGSYDLLRLPLALALGAALLASGPLAAPGRAGAALLAVLGVQALSLLVSPDPAAGMAAALVTAAGFAAYTAARDVRGDPRLLAVLSGVLLSVAVLQRARGVSAASLLGNSNYAGAFAAMLLPALAAGPRNRLAWLGAAAAGALLALSSSRGGLVGAGAGAAVSAALLWRGGRRREAGVLAAVLFIAGALGLAAHPMKFLSSETLTVRSETWKGAFRMAADRPALGVGAGGFGAAFPPYRSAEEARVTQRDAGREFREVEDAHSSWVQSFAEGGVPGLLAWLLLAGVAFRLACRAGPDGAGWAGAVTAFLAAGFFNTLSAHAAPMIFFGVALGGLEPPGPARAPRAAALTSAVALTLGALWGAARIGADLTYHRAIASADPAERLTLAAQGTGWRASYQRGVELDRNGRPREAADAYRAALEARPFHGASLNNLAIALLKSGEPRAEAERWLARALEVAPHYYMAHFNLGQLWREAGRLEARAMFERAAWLNEGHGASRYGIGETYLAVGDVPGALPHLRRARELGMDVAAALRRDFPALTGDPRLAEFRR
jgi:O-antigen ligase